MRMIGGRRRGRRARRRLRGASPAPRPAPPRARRVPPGEPAQTGRGGGPRGGTRGACAERRLLSRGRTPLSHLPDKHHENSAAHTVIAAPAAGRVSTSPFPRGESESEISPPPSSLRPPPAAAPVAPARDALPGPPAARRPLGPLNPRPRRPLGPLRALGPGLAPSAPPDLPAFLRPRRPSDLSALRASLVPAGRPQRPRPLSLPPPGPVRRPGSASSEEGGVPAASPLPQPRGRGRLPSPAQDARGGAWAGGAWLRSRETRKARGRPRGRGPSGRREQPEPPLAGVPTPCRVRGCVPAEGAVVSGPEASSPPGRGGGCPCPRGRAPGRAGRRVSLGSESERGAGRLSQAPAPRPAPKRPGDEGRGNGSPGDGAITGWAAGPGERGRVTSERGWCR